MVVLAKREMCFWPAEIRKKLDIFEMHTSLGPGAQKLFRPKGRKLDTANCHFRCAGGNSCIFSWNEFFSSVFQVLDLSFVVLQCHGNVCNWNPKLI